ncbi:hypothetical protein OG422_31465 (plasmid) [Streptomyces sp. NBC_01525]|uniref:hypothetical protein n=1 Tax=Streptomyces sp. NBC_01525 TaxID=2903893 RepID=UPI002F90CC60
MPTSLPPPGTPPTGCPPQHDNSIGVGASDDSKAREVLVAADAGGDALHELRQGLGLLEPTD